MSYWVSVQPDVEYPEMFDRNLTYNVKVMLNRAGIHPWVLDGLTVKDVRPVIENAYMVMFDNPDYFRRFEAPNGWGTYESTMSVITDLNDYLATAPDEYVMRWR